MKQNELRIGNWIGIVLPEAETQATVDHIKWISEGDNIYKPIPLTEEWLVKFGFIKAIDDNIWVNQSSYQSSYQLTFNSQIGASLYENSHWIKSDIKYVHTLQNLYFALTGEELEVKN